MKVFVAGATGRVGQILVDELVQAGHEVVAGARHPEAIKNTLAQKVMLDLHAPLTEIKALLGQVDAVIFAAGSRGKDLLQVDLNGSVKLQEASKQNGIKRFVQLSSAYSLDQAKWDAIPALKALYYYNLAKFYADRWLIDNPGLDWTILQAGALVETPATGTTTFNDGQVGRNSIADVAKVLAQIVVCDNTIGHVLMMHDGDTPIKQALAEIK